MISSSNYAESKRGFTDDELRGILERAISDQKEMLRRVLLLPPDFTRYHSNAGRITRMLYEMLKDTCAVDIMPALGTHMPVSRDQWDVMYAGIPYEEMLVHHWRSDVEQIGVVPAAFVQEVSEGLISEPIAVEVNHRLLSGAYDLILSIGQVIPHEVVGMANRNKNIFVGCGGSRMINATHMLGAFYGMDRIIGRDRTPVRQVFDYAEAHFLKDIPLCYILTVTSVDEAENILTHGLFIGRERERFEDAVALALKKNFTLVDRPLDRVVVRMDENEFKTTWLANKAVYRTRFALAQDADLIILAPGVHRFGEDEAVDALIRKYGYCGRERILELVKAHDDLRANLSAAAHLIHGSDDGLFHITYCTRDLSQAEVEGVGYRYMPYDAAARRYNPENLKPGWNTLPDGECFYYIDKPATGLWASPGRIPDVG